MKYILASLFLFLMTGNAMAQAVPNQKPSSLPDTGASTGTYFYNSNPLIILQAGTEMYKLDKSVILDEIDVTWIESMDVLKGAQATEKFGKEGKDGVVLITFKEGVEEAAFYLADLKKKSKK